MKIGYWDKFFLKFLVAVFLAAVVGISAFAALYAYANEKSTAESPAFAAEFSPLPPYTLPKSPDLNYYDFIFLSVRAWAGQSADGIQPASRLARVLMSTEQFLGILTFIFVIALATRVPNQRQAAGRQGESTQS